jgi:hypothetical protein
MVFDRVDAVANRAHTDDGTMLFVWLAIEGLQPRPFGFSPSVAVDLLAAIHFVSQQAEIARDRLAAQGHAFPHTLSRFKRQRRWRHLSLTKSAYGYFFVIIQDLISLYLRILHELCEIDSMLLCRQLRNCRNRRIKNLTHARSFWGVSRMKLSQLR